MPFQFHMDAWPWKVALVAAILGVREFIRLMSPREATTGAVLVDGPESALSEGPVSGVASRDDGEGTRWLVEMLDSAAIAIGLVLFVIQPFLLQAFYIPSASMEDTLTEGDRLLVSKLVYRLRDPHFQDVVVFRAPPSAQQPPDTDFIKRCIGTPGDIITAENRRYYRNGKLVEEPYVKWSPDSSRPSAYDMKIVDGKIYSREYSRYEPPSLWVCAGDTIGAADQETVERAKPGPVPAGYYLMLGDHRNNSHDSHKWGFVPRANIIGKAVCVFWPHYRVGLLDRMSFHPRVDTALVVPTPVRPFAG